MWETEAGGHVQGQHGQFRETLSQKFKNSFEILCVWVFDCPMHVTIET